jgi:hypothetical protein
LAEPKQDESFKVVDRRLFNAEGEIRDEAVRQERIKEEVQPGAAAPTSKTTVAGAGTQGQPTTAEAPKPSRGFQMLVNFVAQNAAMLLGAYPDPRTGQPLLDLEGAREMIDMLDALREASRGNVASDDERLLLDVLGSLKLSFMEMTKAAAKATREQAKAHR